MRRRSRAGSTKPPRRKASAAKRRRGVETSPGVTSSASNEKLRFALLSRKLSEARRHRRRAEEALQASEDKLRQIIESAVPGMLWVTGPDGEVTRVNQRTLDFTGARSVEDIRNLGWKKFLHPEDYPKTAEAFFHAIQTGESYENLQRVRRIDGEYRWHHVRAEPLRGRDGSIIEWYGLSVDVDEGRTAEDRLRRSEAHLAEAQRLSHTGSWVLEPATRKILYWSEENYRIWGFDPAHGLPYRADVLQRIHPDDRDRVLDEAQEALREKRDYTIEFRVVLSDGTVKDLEAIGYHLFSERGELIHVVGTNVDVTDRKRAEKALRESERKLRQIIETLPSLIWATTPDGEPSQLNQRVLDYSDMRFEDFLNGGWGRFIHPDDLAETAKALNHAIQTGTSYETVHRLRRADGEYRWHHALGEPLRDEDGRVIHWYGLAIDVDEAKKAEERLRRSESYLAESQRLSHAGTAVFNQTEIFYWSDETYRFFGFDPSQGIPSRDAVWQRIHPDDAGKRNEAIERAVSEKKSVTTEFRILAPDGIVKYIQAINYPVFSSNGDFVEIIGTAIDVTERKRAEQALREREAKIRRLVDANIIGIFIWDFDGRILEANEAFLNVVGFDHEDLVAGRVRWTDLTPPEWRDRDVQLIQKHKATGSLPPFEKEFFRKNGSRVPVLIGVATFEGSENQGVAFVIDLTERKRAEEALRRDEAWLAQAQRLSHTGTWVMDGTTRRFLYWSDESYRIWGLDPLQGLPSREDMWARIHPDDRERVWGEVQEAMREQRDFFGEFRIVLPDGTVRYLEANTHHVFSPLGALLEVLCTSVDVTERKRVQDERERLRQLESDLAHMNRVSMMGELAASLSHEIAQPIATARNNARAAMHFLARNPSEPGEAEEALACVVNDADRAAEILGRIRDQIKKTPPRVERVDLNRAIADVIALAQSAIIQNGVSVQTDLIEELPHVQADRVQLQQVILNLILNAVEAMSSVEKRVRQLSISTQQHQSGGVLVSVRDSGPGIDLEHLNRVFDAFYTTKSRGVGMGLSICRSIIRAHSGELWADVNPSGGAVFRFTLPSVNRNS